MHSFYKIMEKYNSLWQSQSVMECCKKDLSITLYQNLGKKREYIFGAFNQWSFNEGENIFSLCTQELLRKFEQKHYTGPFF